MLHSERPAEGYDTGNLVKIATFTLPANVENGKAGVIRASASTATTWPTR